MVIGTLIVFVLKYIWHSHHFCIELYQLQCKNDESANNHVLYVKIR